MKSRVVLLVAAALAAGLFVSRYAGVSRLQVFPAASVTAPVAPNGTPSAASTTSASPVAGSNTPAAAVPVSPVATISSVSNPYAGGLKQPGRSKRAWDAGFLQAQAGAASGTPIQFELTGGRLAVGTVKITTLRDGELVYLSGELTEPETGTFFFLRPPVGGKAGKAVGVVEFPASQTAYRVEPTGPNGEPELWERRLDEVLCVGLPPRIQSAEETTDAVAIPPLRPDLVPNPVPSYNDNIVSLQSLPGAKAVLLLDFFGGYTPSWGGVTYVRPAAANNSTIRDVWKRVAEDYLPFNINVTTDIEVYRAAPETSRQRCAFTTTPVTAAGVAYQGSWNWGGDVPCWSVYITGKSAAEVASHEVGHTLGLSHMGSSSAEYEDGHGSGATGWTPIMGVGYYQPVATWTKGDYENSNNTQDELATIVADNNDVAYRADDTGSVLGNSRYLEVYPDESVFAEGVIERTGDIDAFQFTTSGGAVSLTGRPVGDWANLAVSATLLNSAGSVIASNNPQTTLSATISTTLAAGTYVFRVQGTGRNNPLVDGFPAYGSLGYYSVNGFVKGGRLPTRLAVVEHATNGTLVGEVPGPAGVASPVYVLVSGNVGNAFSLSADGKLKVASSGQLDYARLASNAVRSVEYELFVNIVDPADSSRNELNRRVLVAVRSATGSYPVEVAGFNAGVVVPYDATPASPSATGFDIAYNFAFYQTGLNGNAQIAGSGGEDGFPANGIVLSQEDGTVFQLGPYRGLNALLLGYNRPTVGTLTLATPRAYNSLAVLASSANGGAQGTLTVNFTDGSKTAFRYNAQDWFGTRTNVAVQGVGRVRLGQGTFSTEDPGWDNPNLYHTTLDLAALGLNKTVASLTFTKPAVGGNHDTAIFALSGAEMPPGAAIAVQPVAVTNEVPAAAASFKVVAMGEPPLSYQWWFKSGAAAAVSLVDETNATVVLPAELALSQAGGYFVVVTNVSGSATSVVASLTVRRAPEFIVQPDVTDLVLFAGSRLSLTAAAVGAAPLQYRWLRDGEFLSGAVSTNYVVPSLGLGHAGAYALTASNAYGVATGAVVSVSVLPDPTNYPYPATAVGYGPAGYWRLDETAGSVAHDYVGGNNGAYSNAVLNQPGYNALDLNRAVKFGPGLNSYVAVPSIDFASRSNAAFTVEAWVKGTAQSSDAGIVTKGTGGGGEQFNLDTGASSRRFRFFVRDAGGGAHLANGTVGPDGAWHHLVGVCDQARSNVLLYVDGVLNASGSIDPGTGLLASDRPMTIGSRQGGSGPYNNQFSGTIDEVAVYPRALTAAEIQAHYAVRNRLPPRFSQDSFTLADATAGRRYTNTVAGRASDPNGETLLYTRSSGPAWLSIAANGVLSGTPVEAGAGTNTFLVRATDPVGLWAEATLHVVVVLPDPFVARFSRQGTRWWLDWTGGQGPFQVETATNLVEPVWVPFGPPTARGPEVIEATNPAAFFRVSGQ
jgi:hypothetical protein